MALKLVLGVGDKVTVGDNVIIEVLYTGHRPQLAFSAPRDIKIHRIPANIDDYGKNAKRVAEGRPKGGSPRFRNLDDTV